MGASWGILLNGAPSPTSPSTFSDLRLSVKQLPRSSAGDLALQGVPIRRLGSPPSFSRYLRYDTGRLGLGVGTISRVPLLRRQERIEVRPHNPVHATIASAHPRPACAQYSRRDPRPYGSPRDLQFSRDLLDGQELIVARALDSSALREGFGEDPELFSKGSDLLADRLANDRRTKASRFIARDNTDHADAGPAAGPSEGLRPPGPRAGGAPPVAPEGELIATVAPKGDLGPDDATRARCGCRGPRGPGVPQGALAGAGPGRNFVPLLCPDFALTGGMGRDGAGSNGSDLSKRFRGFGG